MKKNKKPIALGILLVCAAVVCAAGLLALRSPKDSVTRYVRENHAELQQFSEELLQDPPFNGRASYNGWTVDAYEEMVQFDTSSRGKSYRGFYYSPQDIPLGFQKTDMEFVPRDGGWYWEETDGNNRMYTEKIMDQWYWFEMRF